MKKILGAVLLGVCCVGTLQADTRYQQTVADATLATSERPAVLALPQMLLGTNEVQLPVTYSPINGDPRSLGVWNLSLSQEFADQLLTSHLHYYLPQRYDRLLLSEQGVELQTATEQMSWQRRMRALPTDPLPADHVPGRIKGYLDSEIAPVLQQVLSDAAEARYLEMNARERGTFITERANQLGMPAEVLESLVTAGYAFAFYLPNVQAELLIRQRRIEHKDKPDEIVYRHYLSVRHNLLLEVMSFDGDDFDSFTYIPSMGHRLSQGRSGATLDRRIRERDPRVQEWLETAITGHFGNHRVGINYQLKHYEDFRIQAPIQARDGRQLQFNVGNQESIRVNQPFRFTRTVDGEQQDLGWGQVIKVGKTCQILPADQRTASELSRVTGSADEMDMAIEHPWTGIKTSIGVSHQMTELDLGFGDTGSGETSHLELATYGNLGYLLNNPILSETWMKLGFGLGMAAGGDYQRFDNASFDSGLSWHVQLGMEKRWLMGSGWFLGTAAGVGFQMRSHTADGAGWNEEPFQNNIDLDGEKFNVGNAYFLPELKLHKNLSPNTRVQLGVGYHLPLGSSASWSDDDISDIDGIDDYYFEDTKLNAGLSANLGFTWLLGAGGALASMTSAPDTTCQDLVEAQNNASN